MKFSFKKIVGATVLAGVVFSPALISTVAAQSATPRMSEQMAAASEVVVLGDLELSSAFTRAMPPRAVTGGGFLTIVNKGDQDDRLVSVSSLVAEHTELHVMSIVDDVMRMQSQPEGFVVLAGEITELKPGGKHIMFINVETPFTKGSDIKVVLHFEKAGDVEVNLHTLAIGAKGMSSQTMDHSNMGSSTETKLN